jgi:primosomal replication protein N
MTSIRHLLLTLLAVSLGLTATSCGGKSPASPTPAQALGETPAPAPAGTATIAGQAVAGSGPLGTNTQAGLAGVTVSVSGTSISVVSDGSGRFVLSNVPAGDQHIDFRGNGASATVTIDRIAEQEHIEITVAVTGSSAEVVDQERVTGAQAQLEGTITAKSEGARTIEVHGVTVKVPSGVPIRHGDTSLTFANLHVEDRVHVKGTKEPSGVTATEVTVQHGEDTPGGGNGDDDHDGDDEGEHAETSLSGSPSAMTGQCPSLTFTLQAKTVKTSASTNFHKATCDEFKSATSVEAEGVLTGNTLDAKKVSIEKD